MAKLTTKQRKKLAASDFGLPKQRKYPMPDPAHAINAEARMTQMKRKGKLTEAQEKKIHAKAKKVLKGGK